MLRVMVKVPKVVKREVRKVVSKVVKVVRREVRIVVAVVAILGTKVVGLSAPSTRKLSHPRVTMRVTPKSIGRSGMMPRRVTIKGGRNKRGRVTRVMIMIRVIMIRPYKRTSRIARMRRRSISTLLHPSSTPTMLLPTNPNPQTLTNPRVGPPTLIIMITTRG